MNAISNPPITCQRYGPNGLIFRLAALPGDSVFETLQGVARLLDESPPSGLVDYFRGFTTITLEFSPELSGNLETIGNGLAEAWSAAAPCAETPRSIEIPVVYNGPDIKRVAEHTGLSPKEVCSRHSAVTYRVHMLGFCPGFPYLHGLDIRLRTPRLDTPRPQVAAGSVAIGGEHTGIYPVNRPGGWNIIGHTSQKLFYPDHASASNPESAFLLRAGDQIRFIPIA